MKKAMVLTLLLVMGSLVLSQTNTIELVRTDVRAEKKKLVEGSMQLGEQEAEVFWPLYRDYEYELGKLFDERLAMLKEYAAHMDTLTDEKADELAMKAFKLKEKRTKLEVATYKKMAKALNPRLAARFFQIDYQINLAIDINIAADVPLVE